MAPLQLDHEEHLLKGQTHITFQITGFQIVSSVCHHVNVNAEARTTNSLEEQWRAAFCSEI